MDYKTATSLLLNGKLYQKNDLIPFARARLANKKSPNWEKPIFTFLLDWLDEKNFIHVKTSGSTGTPKNIRIQKRFMVHSALKTGAFLNLRKGDKALLCLPAKYIAGKMMLVRAMVLQLNLTIEAPSSNPVKNTDNPFDFAAMVPMQVHEILGDAESAAKLNSIKHLIIGGAPLSGSLRNKIKALKNNCYLTYGMTETITHIAMEKLNGNNADGWLHTLPGIFVSPDESDRLIIDAPGDCDTKVQTNDLAKIKDNQTFKIIGRFDNLFISGGLNIIPEEIEKKIEHLVLYNFIISSFPDEKLGEMAVLVLEGKPLDPTGQFELLSKIAAIIPKHQHPKRIYFLNTFPKTGNQKTDRRRIKEMISGKSS